MARNEFKNLSMECDFQQGFVITILRDQCTKDRHLYVYRQQMILSNVDDQRSQYMDALFLITGHTSIYHYHQWKSK